MNLWLVLRASPCVRWAMWHFMPHQHRTGIQITLEIVIGCRVDQCHQAGKASLSPAEKGQQPESQDQPARERALLDATASVVHVTLHRAPRCQPVVPSRLFCTLRDDNREAFIASSGSGLWSHPHRRQLVVIGGLLVWTGMSNPTLT